MLFQTSNIKIFPNSKLSIIYTAILSCGVILTSIFVVYKKKNKELAPGKWIKVGTVSELTIFPVKSCKGIKVDQCEMTSLGLRASKYMRDRAFMIVDSKGIDQTRIRIPKLALIDVHIDENSVVLNGSEGKSITFTPPNENNQMQMSCLVLREKVKGYDCGDEVAMWLDKYLNKTGLRLVYHSDTQTTQRNVTNEQKNFSGFTSQIKGSFQGKSSYMLMTEESIGFLNSKLKTPVSHHNFRPTILIKGTPEPFSEDFWSYVKIGSNENFAILRAPMPCARCPSIIVDPFTGIVNSDGEPLKTLKTIKRTIKDEYTTNLMKNKGVLGILLGLVEPKCALIKTGDPIYAAIL